MPDLFLYLAIDAGVLLIPFLFSFHPGIKFYREWKVFIPACLITIIPFIVWDVAFTKAGVWGFNERYLTGLNLLNLPVEEWLFFVCIPYACVFTFYCFGLIAWERKFQWPYVVLACIAVFFIGIAILHSARDYTFMTFLLTGLVLGYLSILQKPVWLPRAVITYILILPFFFVSNGLLTGSWIAEQVVWYNDNENLGIRIGTIPIEDTVYGFLLILMNIILYERLRRLKYT